jgi:hypothetical protein
MEEYHIDCHLLSKLDAMALFHCIVLSYIVIMIININVRASLFNIKVNAIANCHAVSWRLALSHRHIIGRYCTILQSSRCVGCCFLSRCCWASRAALGCVQCCCCWPAVACRAAAVACRARDCVISLLVVWVDCRFSVIASV